jgi:hypothetical protein
MKDKFKLFKNLQYFPTELISAVGTKKYDVITYMPRYTETIYTSCDCGCNGEYKVVHPEGWVGFTIYDIGYRFSNKIRLIRVELITDKKYRINSDLNINPPCFINPKYLKEKDKIKDYINQLVKKSSNALI